MLTSILRFILIIPQNVQEFLCRHKWEHLAQDPSDWHSARECRKCGKIDTEFMK